MRERRRVFESTITLNNEGRGGISEAMTSGFIVSSKGRIVVDSYPGGGVISHHHKRLSHWGNINISMEVVDVFFFSHIFRESIRY